MTSSFIDHVAQNMHAEAYLLGMVKQSWLNEDSATQDGWRMIAEAAISAIEADKRLATSDR